MVQKFSHFIYSSKEGSLWKNAYIFQSGVMDSATAQEAQILQMDTNPGTALNWDNN